ncbi:MAG: amidohydrolase [Candidatus Methanomethylicia archaeon]|nr:amidohydrolase [Candidatus Methanomethylicia archaeon]
MQYILRGKSIVTMGSKGIIRNGCIVIEDGIIVDVDEENKIKSKYHGYDVVDARNCILIPGLINTHTHIAMSLLRGYADDLQLHEWLEKWIWPIEAKIGGREIYIGAKLSILEAIRSGTTTICSMYHYKEDYNEARAIYEAGVRGIISHPFFDWRINEDYKLTEDLIRNWHGKNNWRIKVAVSPHAPYTVSPKNLIEIKEYVKNINLNYSGKERIIIHIHVAETKDEMKIVNEKYNVDTSKGLFKYLNDIGFLSEEILAAHCVWLTNTDIEVMKKMKVKVSHNPISNLKLASGISPIVKMLEEGIVVSLGTDGPCSNNTLDIFETMKIASLLQKGITLNPTVVPAMETIKMATINGAIALGLNEIIGSIEIGKKADIVAIEIGKPHLTPIYNEVSHIAYAVRYGDVKHVIVDGKFIMEDRNIKTLNEVEVIKEAEEVKDELINKMRG